MEQAVAIDLIREGIIPSVPAHWADLGAGTGVFTAALAKLIPGEGNIIYAIDNDLSSLSKIDQHIGNVAILKMPFNFELDELPLRDLDGILMANSFHFVLDKLALLSKLKKILKPTGCMLIVEYDTLIPNPWIPYPINFVTLKKIMRDIGFSNVIKLGHIPSRYNQSNMYSALVR